MKKLIHNSIVLPYNIDKKKNKNTYFYFKKEGYVQVNMSRYQSEEMILNYMKSNIKHFKEKLDQHTHIEDPNTYYLFGKKYHKVIGDYQVIHYDQEHMYLPKEHADHLQKFEKTMLLQFVSTLVDKYKRNSCVDISNILIKTRYTKTRFGSCNPKKRTINLSTYLVHYDPLYIEYVFCHEIAHLDVANHSKDFYTLLEKLFPNHRRIKKELRKQYR